MADDTPRILGGRYEVGELIGRGGMAEVHIGHDTRLGRTVAIKILRSDLARDPSFQARFRREAQAAASLNHPSIVAVYDTGEDVFTEAHGGVGHVPFIVMEYVEGHTVRDILRDGAAVPIEEALEITSGVLSALEYSHHAGIVHRDIKPANVMLTPTGAVKVMDFGIARAMADAAGTMTQTQAVIGTAQYLSPEQARGEAVDARSDLYSTGCLLFELLTGRPPFIGDSPVAVAYQHAREEAQPPSTFASDVPDSLDRITMKALAKDRDARYSTAAEFRSELESAGRGGHISAPAVGTAVMGAGAIAAGPAAAATQVLGATPAATQAMPAAVPWSQVAVEPPMAPPRRAPERVEDERRRGWLPWVLALVAIAAIAGIIYMLTAGDGEETPTTAEVPDVVGQQVEDAQAELAELGLVGKPITEASAEEPGTVISTDPGAGEEVPLESDVTLVVSAGPDPVTIPGLSNLSADQAEDELIELGFAGENIDVATQDSPTVEKDRVTTTDPPAGTEVLPTSDITIFLSTGQVQLPDLRGMPEADARQVLVDLGLTPVVSQEESSDVEAGDVISQDRSPGPVPQRSAVEITVATTPAVKTAVVPDVEGLRWDQVQAAFADRNILAEQGGEETSDTVPTDRATRSEPVAGSTVDEGSVVKVWISVGPDPVADPGDGDGEGG